MLKIVGHVPRVSHSTGIFTQLLGDNAIDVPQRKLRGTCPPCRGTRRVPPVPREIYSPEFDWHHLIACPGEPPVSRKHLGDISYTRRVIGDFVLNFLAMATGFVVVEFVWHHSVAHPRIPPTRRKRHRDIFYTSGVIACFVSNFIAMATRVNPLRIWLTSFDSLSRRTPC